MFAFTLAPNRKISLFKAPQFHISNKNSIVIGLTSAWFVGKYIALTNEMEICLIGKPSLDTTLKPKRTPKQKKVETINSDSDSEFGIPKKTAPKGEDYQ